MKPNLKLRHILWAIYFLGIFGIIFYFVPVLGSGPWKRMLILLLAGITAVSALVCLLLMRRKKAAPKAGVLKPADEMPEAVSGSGMTRSDSDSGSTESVSAAESTESASADATSDDLPDEFSFLSEKEEKRLKRTEKRVARRKARSENPVRLRSWHLPLMLLHAGYCYLMLEIVNNPNFKEIAPLYVCVNLLGIFILNWIVFWALNSWRLSMILFTAFMTVMSAVFYMVMLFRGEPFQLIDIFSVGTAVEVAGNYELKLPIALAVFIVLSLCLVAIYAHLPNWKLIRANHLKKVILRLGLLLFLWLGNLFYLNTGWNAALGILTDLFSPIKTYREYGTELGFFCVAKYMRLTEPEGYSAGTAKKLAEASMKQAAKSQETEARAADEQASKSQGPETKGRAATVQGSDETQLVQNALSSFKSSTDVKPVNIIAIMNESWADYRLLGENFSTNYPLMEYYDSLHENTIKGHSLVCIEGGGTAKTEYEFLTGNSVSRFPAMVPYVSYFTHEQYSLVTTLEAQGYSSLAMHPYKAKNWNRPAAYRLLNFDRFMSEPDWPSDADRLRGLISDQGDYDEIIRQVDAKENQDDPLFIFNITMQNHGGYQKGTYYGEVTVDGYEDLAVRNYLSLIRESDAALKELIEHFKQVEEPTIICVFGDHYPELPESFAEHIAGKHRSEFTFDEEEHCFATPFLIWANYDIPEQENVVTSMNFLSTLLLQQTGLTPAPYQIYLQQLQEIFPAMNHLGYYDLQSGQYRKWEDADDKVKKAKKGYDILQYNNLAEKRKRLDFFFGMKTAIP